MEMENTEKETVTVSKADYDMMRSMLADYIPYSQRLEFDLKNKAKQVSILTSENARLKSLVDFHRWENTFGRENSLNS